MPAMVATLSEADIRAIAEYYGKQGPALKTEYRQVFSFGK
jgi:cytochrome c553